MGESWEGERKLLLAMVIGSSVCDLWNAQW